MPFVRLSAVSKDVARRNPRKGRFHCMAIVPINAKTSTQAFTSVTAPMTAAALTGTPRSNRQVSHSTAS